MQNIYQEAVRKVEEGNRFKVDFKNRSLRIGKKQIIKDGEYEGSLGLEITLNPLPEIIRLFHRYHHSIPSERSECKRKRYFHALSEHELSDEDMMYGEYRETAQIKLELYVLIMILNGSLRWDRFAKGKWFWQSEEEQNLVILKDWIEPINK